MFSRRNVLVGSGATLSLAVLPHRPSFAQAAPFRIGALNPVTGAGNQYGPGMQAIIRAQIDVINAAGGAAGRKLELFAEDTQSRPEQAVLAAKKLVDVNKVDALLGTWSAGEAMAVLSAVSDPSRVIHMTTAGASEFVTEDKHDLGWRFSMPSYAFGVVYAKLVKEMGYTRPAVLNFNNPSGNGQAAGFKDSWTKGGGSIAASLVYEPNRPTYRSEIQQILAARPDVVICAGYIIDSTSIIREWYQTGIPTKFILPFWAADQRLVDAVGAQALEGINVVAPEQPSDSKSAKDFDALYKKATGNPGASNSYAAMCYDMVTVLALAIQAAGPAADRTAVNGKIRDVANPPGEIVFDFAGGKALLEAGKEIDYSGACSTLQFDKDGEETATAFRWEQFSGGKTALKKHISLLD